MEFTDMEAQKMGLRNATDQHNVRSTDFASIYTNNVGIGATNWDISLTFGEILGNHEDGNPVVEQKVKINMTREFMKALSNLLATSVKAYEEKYGEIDFTKLFAIAEDVEAAVAQKRASSKETPAKKSKS